MTQRLVVAYSGSAGSTLAVRTLAAAGAEVVTLTVDVGQGHELEPVRAAALAAGATRAHVIDAREAFARDYVLPALEAGVPPGGWLPLVRTLSVPLVAATLREIAQIEDAAVDEGVADVDASLVGRIVSGDVYRLTKAPAAAPLAPALVTLTFERGVPAAINDVSMPLIELLESLAIIAGRHGVGRVEQVEAPAAVVLHTAMRARGQDVVRLRLFKGTCEQVPELVTHT